MVRTTTPPKLPEDPAILVRLTPDDYLAVAWNARTDGQSMGGYVRTLVRRHLRTIATAATEPSACGEVIL